MINPHAEALAAYERGDYPAAISWFDAVLATSRDDATALFNSGQALFELGDYAEAARRFERVTEIMPHEARPWFKFGIACLYAERYVEALAATELACQMEPWQPEYQDGLGVALASHGQHAGAIKHFRAARVFEERWSVPPVNEAYSWLHLGIWHQAWPLFEARRNMGVTAPLEGPPLWRGEDLRGKTIWVRKEQGFGDCLMFVRFVPELKKRGAYVMLEPEIGLERIWKSVPGVARHLAKGELCLHADYQTSLMSLPLGFGTEPGTVPPPVRFMPAATDVAYWTNMLPSRPLVGLCYEAGIRADQPRAYAIGRHKSVPSELVEPLWDIATVISLQKSDIDARLGRSADFADTAALVENLDLVISVDTSIAHLSASMGKPTWLLNPADSCWRWRGDGTDWYPTVTKYQQETIGDWTPVIARVRRDLKEWVG